jgi:cytochrome c
LARRATRGINRSRQGLFGVIRTVGAGDQGRVMSDLRNNTIFGAILASVLGVMGIGILAENVFHPNYPEKPGFAPEVAEATGGAAGEADRPPDFGLIFADATQLADLVARGERSVAACRACHTFEAGGANGTGPNLHDVFGRQVASHAGFAYSDAMAAHGGAWEYGSLDEFLTSPSRAVPGTKMVFAGFRRPEDRMAVIAYLRSISPNNVPLPAPLPAEAAAAPTEGAAPAEGAPAAPATPR